MTMYTSQVSWQISVYNPCFLSSLVCYVFAHLSILLPGIHSGGDSRAAASISN